jgi:hypothetical protein
MSHFPPLTFMVVVALGNQDSNDHRVSQIANLFNRGIRRLHLFAFASFSLLLLLTFGLRFLIEYRQECCKIT